MVLTHRCHCDGLTNHCLAAKLLGIIIKLCSACVLIKLNARLPFASCLESSFCLMPSVSLFMPMCMRLKVQSLSHLCNCARSPRCFHPKSSCSSCSSQVLVLDQLCQLHQVLYHGGHHHHCRGQTPRHTGLDTLFIYMYIYEYIYIYIYELSNYICMCPHAFDIAGPAMTNYYIKGGNMQLLPQFCYVSV